MQVGLSRHIANWKRFVPKEETNCWWTTLRTRSTTEYTKEIKAATGEKKFPPY